MLRNKPLDHNIRQEVMPRRTLAEELAELATTGPAPGAALHHLQLPVDAEEGLLRSKRTDIEQSSQLQEVLSGECGSLMNFGNWQQRQRAASHLVLRSLVRELFAGCRKVTSAGHFCIIAARQVVSNHTGNPGRSCERGMYSQLASRRP